MSNNVIVNARFFPPKHDKHEYYRSGQYNEYIKSRLEDTGNSFENNFDYITNREGSNGWWCNNESGKLEKIDAESMIWSLVVSFDKEFAAKNNIFNSEQTKVLINKTIGELMINNGMDPKNIQYVAAHHSNTEHPHVHIMMNERRPISFSHVDGYGDWRKRGKLTTKSFDALKANIEGLAVSNKFNWSHFSKQRDDMKRMIISNKTKQSIAFAESVVMINDTLKKRKKNRVSYTSLSPNLKNEIDQAFNKLLLGNPEIKKAYEKLEIDFESSKHRYANNSSAMMKQDILFSKRYEEIKTGLKNKLIKAAIEMDGKFVQQPIRPTKAAAGKYRARQKQRITKNKRSIASMLKQMQNTSKTNSSNLDQELKRLSHEFDSKKQKEKQYEDQVF